MSKENLLLHSLKRQDSNIILNTYLQKQDKNRSIYSTSHKTTRQTRKRQCSDKIVFFNTSQEQQKIEYQAASYLKLISEGKQSRENLKIKIPKTSPINWNGNTRLRTLTKQNSRDISAWEPSITLQNTIISIPQVTVTDIKNDQSRVGGQSGYQSTQTTTSKYTTSDYQLREKHEKKPFYRQQARLSTSISPPFPMKEQKIAVYPFKPQIPIKKQTRTLREQIDNFSVERNRGWIYYFKQSHTSIPQIKKHRQVDSRRCSTFVNTNVNAEQYKKYQPMFDALKRGYL